MEAEGSPCSCPIEMIQDVPWEIELRPLDSQPSVSIYAHKLWFIPFWVNLDYVTPSAKNLQRFAVSNAKNDLGWGYRNHCVAGRKLSRRLHSTHTHTHKCPLPNAKNLWICHFTWQNDLTAVIKNFEMRRWSKWPQPNHMKPLKAVQDVVREKCNYGKMVREMWCCWFWRWKEGAMSQGMQAAYRRCK